MKVAVVLGTRPEIIKLAPVIKEFLTKNTEIVFIHTNQHYSYEMDEIFLKELNLPKAKYNLKLSGIKHHGEMVGRMLIKIERVLLKEKPDLVVVQGDTNSTLAGALSASKLGIKLAHIEAGLRSYDRTMPEELNRIVVDHLSDLLFCPSERQRQILLKEGVNEEKIFVVGNTIVDSIWENIKLAEKKPELVSKYKRENYFLLTLHRPSNVDSPKPLLKIIKSLEKVCDLYGGFFLFPIHPRTLNNLQKFKIKVDERKIKIVQPIGYFEMLIAEKYSRLIFTDSGGIQEEACVLKVPCITLRENTERPETIDVGANILVGSDEEKILEAVKKSLNKKRDWENPYGKDVSKKIIKIILSKYGKNTSKRKNL